MDLMPVRSILVPVDFSANSAKAVEFAARLAESLTCRLVLHYVHPVAIVVSGEHMTGFPEHELKHAAEKEMEEFVVRFRSLFPAVKFTTAFSQGIIADEIVDYSRSHNADLIIMGTHGAHGIEQKLFGSNTADVVTHSSIPVLAVPVQASYTGFNKVVFATTFMDNDFQTLYHLCELFRPLNPAIEVLHVHLQKERDAEHSLAEFATQVKANIPYKNISFRIIEGSDVEHSLEEYMEQSSADIVALASRRRNFFEKLTQSSLSKKMAFHTKKPLLVFHSFTKSSYPLF